MLTLYHCPKSRSARALWMLEEVGCSYALKLIDFRAGEGANPAYRQLNPHGKVPTLVHDGAIIPDTTAILLHLADAFPEARLAPPVGDPRRGPYLAWMTYTTGVIEPHLAARMQGHQYDASKVAWGAYDDMVAHLRDGVGHAAPHLLGEFTAADILIGTALQIGMLMGHLPRLPVFEDYVTTLTARPACRRAQAKDDAAATASHTLKEARVARGAP